MLYPVFFLCVLILNEIMICRLSIPYKEWYSGVSDKYYGQCFIGLALSDFTGATGSVVDMGMRGLRVVTNVANMPHCIPWRAVDDIEGAINKESSNIGVKDNELAEMVVDEMVIGAKGFDLSKLIIDK